jgi:hypothetical protein
MVMNMHCVLLNNLIVVFKFLSLMIALAYMHVLLFVKLVQGTWDIVQWHKNPAAVKKLFCRSTKFYYQFGLAGWVGEKMTVFARTVSLLYSASNIGFRSAISQRQSSWSYIIILSIFHKWIARRRVKIQDYQSIHLSILEKGHSLTYRMTRAYPNYRTLGHHNLVWYRVLPMTPLIVNPLLQGTMWHIPWQKPRRTLLV